jgi:CRISPR/Cas system CSM-associated protein Csm3 (group 7 of RAMP superfamily)
MTQEDSAFDLIPFPGQSPVLQQRFEHGRLGDDRIHGYFELALTAKTPVHVSSGIRALGKDVGHPNIPLITPMVQSKEGKLIIQGSSLKGCLRAIYEVITNSKSGTQSKMQLPDGFEPPKGRELCAAGRVFGAMGYQGLVSFTDAVCETPAEVGYLSPMHTPGSKTRYLDRGFAKGRKFYYLNSSDEANKTVPILQAPRDAVFKTRLQFKNLDAAELGALLIALGQDQDPHAIALKLGAGKNQGMGVVTVQITKAEIMQVRDRYASYDAPASVWSDAMKQQWIEAAHKTLIVGSQLEALVKILGE